MRKFIYFPLWNINKIENILRDKENQGFKLMGVKFSSLFYFKKSIPKDVEYVLTYNFVKSNKAAMHEWQRKLISEYGAQEIPCINCDYHLCRITKPVDLTEFKKYRCHYMKYVLLQYLLMILVFVLSGIFLFVTTMLGDTGIGVKIISSTYLSITIIALFYIVYGYIKQLKADTK